MRPERLPDSAIFLPPRRGTVADGFFSCEEKLVYSNEDGGKIDHIVRVMEGR